MRPDRKYYKYEMNLIKIKFKNILGARARKKKELWTNFHIKKKF